jgi:Bacterial pre-peptidase C-terminal domain
VPHIDWRGILDWGGHSVSNQCAPARDVLIELFGRLKASRYTCGTKAPQSSVRMVRILMPAHRNPVATLLRKLSCSPAWLLLLASVLPAAPKIPAIRPQVQGVFPHGAQRGTQVEVAIKGKDLQDTREIRFFSSKLKAEIFHSAHNLVRVRFRLDSSAEPGRHDFRLIAPHGSTVGWFDVSTRAESFEKEPNDTIVSPQAVEFPLLINGTIKAGDYDHFRFTARKGQTLTFDINATRNGSPLDPVISLHDANGAEIAYSDDYYPFKDAHIVHTFDNAGEYVVRVYGTGESGSDTSDYRLTAGEMSQVDHAMPMGGQRAKEIEVRLSGVNLSNVDNVVLGDGLASAQILSCTPRSATVRLKIPESASPGIYRLHVAGATLPVPFVISDLPEVTLGGNAGRSKQEAFPVDLPVVANGVLDRPKAAHYFSFRIEEPQTLLLAADSMQFGFMLDPMVAIYDESGKRIAYQDEPTTNTGRDPANMDPHLAVPLSKPGRYTAMVRDNAFRGDPTYAYRLTVKRAEPSFSLKVIGTDETLFRDKENIVTLRVRRLEGWNTPVEVWAEDLPEGVTAPKIVVQPVNTPFRNTCGEEHVLDGTNVEVPLQVAANAPQVLSQIRFKGRGVMDGRTVEREAHTRYWWRVNQKILGDAQTGRLHITIADSPELLLSAADKVTVVPGKAASIKVLVDRFDAGNVPLEIAGEAPGGIVVEPATVQGSATTAVVKVTSTVDRPAAVVLVGKADGRLLGKSHPIVIDPSGKTAPEEASDSED